jgi:hypothetical protein
MVDQVTLDIGGAVSAGLSVVTTVANLLVGSRSVTIELDNNTDLALNRLSMHHVHGKFAKYPAAIIEPGKADVFASESRSPSVMTGTEGYVRYGTHTKQLSITVYWDNPYLGDNKVRARLDYPDAKDYMMFIIGGSGNTQAPFRFELFPRSQFPDQPQIVDISDT